MKGKEKNESTEKTKLTYNEVKIGNWLPGAGQWGHR